MELKPSSLIVGILIIAIGSLIAMTIANDYSDRYDEALPSDSTFNFSNYDMSEDSRNISDQMRDKMIGANQTTDSSADFVDTFLKSTWESLKLSFKSLGFASKLSQVVADDLGVPSWFSSIIMTIIILLFLFTIISAFFKIKGL